MVRLFIVVLSVLRSEPVVNSPKRKRGLPFDDLHHVAVRVADKKALCKAQPVVREDYWIRRHERVRTGTQPLRRHIYVVHHQGDLPVRYRPLGEWLP